MSQFEATIFVSADDSVILKLLSC